MKVLSAVAWPYANGPRHLGHVAGFGVPSDVFSRYMRMAGHDVLMVSGSDEHGTPILVLADQAEVTPREFVDTNHAVIAGELTDLGCSYDLYTRTTTANHYAVAQELFTQVWTQRLHGRADHPGRHLAVDRAHAARPLHRGHLPDLRLRRGPRRPVRQLRQPARPDRPDRPAQPDQRRDTDVRRDPALPARPAGARRRPARLARGARGVGHLAAQRHQVQPEHPRRHPPARDDPRHRLGHPGAARRLARQPDQAALRLVRRGRRLPLGVGGVGATHRRPRALARVVERPRGGLPLLHGQGQHHLPLPDLAGRAARLRRQGQPRRRAGASSASSTCPPRSSRASTSRWRASSSPPRAATRSSCATCSSATGPTASATSSARPAPRTRTPTSPGATSCSATTPSSSPAGATSSRARRRWSPRTSARSRSRARSSRSTRRCAPRCSPGSTPSGACSSGTARRPRSPRRCGSSARSTPTSRAPSRSSSRATTSASGSRRCCTRSCSACPTSTRCWRRSSRTRPTGSTRCSAATARSCRCRASRR